MILPKIDDPKPSGKPLPNKTSGNFGITPQRLYRLYFKGLVREHSLAGFGVAICDQYDKLLFQMKGPIHSPNVTVLESELTALQRGLTEAATLRINHLSIYFDYQPLYKLVTGQSMLEENNPSLLLDDVQRILRIFTSNFPVFVAKDKIKYAYKLARETIVSETSIHVDRITRKKTCGICLDEDINADQMFSVDKCRHRFCSECVKRYIEVRLLERSVLRCPHHRCKSKLSFGRCDHLLTAKLREMLEKRIKEDSIAVTERIYCPNPRCSALMSETEMLKSTKKSGVRRCCVQCIEPFCIHCKVPWHDNMSCDDYKRLHSDEPTTDDAKLKALANQKRWRQCGKCQHMIELSKGCVRVRCRCGHGFCYQCGAERCTHGHAFPRPPPPPPRPLPPGFWLHILSGVFGIVILVGTVLFICMQGRLIG